MYRRAVECAAKVDVSLFDVVRGAKHSNRLQHAAIHLWHTRCNTLVAIYTSLFNAMQHMQHTTTRCNTLQDTTAL